MSRRRFLGVAGAGAAALVLGPGEAYAAGYGPLVRDPGGVVDLPRGFQYRIISQEGGKLSNGAPIPGDPDGMAAFRGPGGTTVLVRNHELRPGDGEPVPGRNRYDTTTLGMGGTTAIIVDRYRRKLREYVTSSGTVNNCAGGATPWGTWLTCEEDMTAGQKRHGFVFEVMPNDPENNLSKTPIEAMGMFAHEAVDIDPATGIAYLTEDSLLGNADGADPNSPEPPKSFLYRYIPNDRTQRPGALQKGGKLQAMAIGPAPRDADDFNQGQRFTVRWVDIVQPELASAEAAAKGAVQFNRLEGTFFAAGALWFSDTAGGEKRLGQIFRYFPRTNTLELFYEGADARQIESPDNLVVTPFGDLWWAEDEIPAVMGDGKNRVQGITSSGQVYTFAGNRISDSEFAGPTFSPDGFTFFVNIQNSRLGGITLAIWGPFSARSTVAQARMAHAAPPVNMGPQITGELVEAAVKHGLSPLEAAAFDLLGVPLL